MDAFDLLSKFLKKTYKEIDGDYTIEQSIFIRYITFLIGKVTGEAEKRLVKLVEMKRPLQNLLDVYTLHKTDYIRQANEMVSNSHEIIGPYTPQFFCDISDEYLFYLVRHPVLSGKNYCIGSIVDKRTKKTIYDFTCSYEQYKSMYYVDNLAIGIFLLNHYLKGR